MNTKRMKIKNYGKYYGNQEHLDGVRKQPFVLKMVLHQENVRNEEDLYLIQFFILIAKAAGAYRPPHLRQTTRQVPKLHEDAPAKPATQHAAPRVAKPGGVEELFTGDLEKDKKIKQIHKVCLFGNE